MDTKVKPSAATSFSAPLSEVVDASLSTIHPKQATFHSIGSVLRNVRRLVAANCSCALTMVICWCLMCFNTSGISCRLLLSTHPFIALVTIITCPCAEHAFSSPMTSWLSRRKLAATLGGGADRTNRVETRAGNKVSSQSNRIRVRAFKV